MTFFPSFGLQKVLDTLERKGYAQESLLVIYSMCQRPMPEFLMGRFHLENKLKMLFSENERCSQEINVDQRQLVLSSFSACIRPHETNTLVLEEKMKMK